MELSEILATSSSIVVALGGWKIAEALIFRKSIKRGKTAEAEVVEATAEAKEAEAMKAKVSAEEARFSLLERQLTSSEERNVRLQEQISAKEERFQEQTIVLRKTNMRADELSDKVVELTRIVGIRDARIAELEAERKMKLCERKGCNRREPQSGY